MLGDVCETGGMRLTLRGLTLVVLTAVVSLFVGVVPASAHSRLISISPKDGASVPGSPPAIVLTFNEDVNPQFVSVRVTDGEGTVVAGDDAAAQGPVVTAPVAEPMSAGTYKVTYRVVSADSHPISGSTTFTVEGDAQASPTAPSESPSGSSAAPSASTSSPAAEPSPSESTVAGDTDTAASGGTPAAVWILVFAGLAAAVAATFYAVRRDGAGA